MSRSAIVTTLILVLAAVFVIYVARNSYWTQETVQMPPKGEAVRNPYYAAQKFADRLGARTEWRHGLGTVPPPNGVIVLSGWHWDLMPQRSVALRNWVEKGGRIVADNTLIGDRSEYSTWAGIEFEELEDDKLPAIETVNVRGQPCRRVNVKAGADTSRNAFMMCTWDDYERPVTQRPVTWSLADRNGLFALRVPIGKGSLTYINAAPFQHQSFLKGDHAQLFAVAAQLRKGDRVYFLSDDRFDSLLTLMWRYGAPVIVLCLALVVLALWRGSARFGPLAAAPDVARRSLGEQILGTGWFTVRHGGGSALRGAAVRALFETARRRIVNFDGLPADERINALAKASRTDAGALAEAINFSGPRRPGDLRDTLVLLETARRTILTRTDS